VAVHELLLLPSLLSNWKSEMGIYKLDEPHSAVATETNATGL